MILSVPVLEHVAAILARARHADHIVVALDFDGTLAPIADRPEQAEIPSETATILKELAETEHVSLSILSGRSIINLKRKLNLDCIYAGNHGLEIEGKGLSFSHEGASRLRYAVELACWDLEEALESVGGVLVERKGLTATVHYRQVLGDLHDWIAAAVHLTLRPYAAWLSLIESRII